MLDYESAKIIWDYHHLNQEIIPSDCIIGVGSHDLHVAERSSELFLSGYGESIIFTGGLGRITKLIWDKPEAEKFTEIAIQSGVPEKSIYIENKSNNTGENIKFTKELIEKNNIKIDQVIVVTRPFNERRLFATLKKQWPELNFKITSPQYSLDDYINFYKNSPQLTVDDFINIIVGEIQRIDLYYKIGYEIKQEIPQVVKDAYLKLIEQGFDKQLIKK